MEREKRPGGRELHIGHRKRIKARYTQRGISWLDDADVIELLLTYAIPRRDVYPLARRLIEEFGSVEGVLKAEPEELADRCGLSAHTVTLLKLVNDIRTRPTRISFYGKKHLSSVRVAAEYCHSVMYSFPDEAVVELFLDEESWLTGITTVASGSNDAVVLPVETIVKNASEQASRRVIVAHNHPSGSSLPSAADVLATEVLAKALAGHGMELVEHFIVSASECSALLHHQVIEISDDSSFMPWERPE